MKLSNRMIVIIVLLALILVAATTWAVAQSSHTYYACVTDGGKYRIVDTQADMQRR